MSPVAVQHLQFKLQDWIEISFRDSIQDLQQNGCCFFSCLTSNKQEQVPAGSAKWPVHSILDQVGAASPLPLIWASRSVYYIQMVLNCFFTLTHNHGKWASIRWETVYNQTPKPIDLYSGFVRVVILTCSGFYKHWLLSTFTDLNNISLKFAI